IPNSTTSTILCPEHRPRWPTAQATVAAAPLTAEPKLHFKMHLKTRKTELLQMFLPFSQSCFLFQEYRRLLGIRTHHLCYSKSFVLVQFSTKSPSWSVTTLSTT